MHQTNFRRYINFLLTGIQCVMFLIYLAYLPINIGIKIESKFNEIKFIDR